MCHFQDATSLASFCVNIFLFYDISFYIHYTLYTIQTTTARLTVSEIISQNFSLNMEIWIDRPVTYMSNILRMKIRNIKYHNNLSYYHLDSLSSYFIPSQHTNIKNIPDCSRIFVIQWTAVCPGHPCLYRRTSQ